MGQKIEGNVEYVCCGDTQFCKECRVLTAFSDTSEPKTMRMQRNNLGRCDFYNGPNTQVHAIAKLD